MWSNFSLASIKKWAKHSWQNLTGDQEKKSAVFDLRSQVVLCQVFISTSLRQRKKFDAPLYHALHPQISYKNRDNLKPVFPIILWFCNMAIFYTCLVVNALYSEGCIFWPVFGVSSTQTLVNMWFFNIYRAKELKKEEKAWKHMQNLAKKLS